MKALVLAPSILDFGHIVEQLGLQTTGPCAADYLARSTQLEGATNSDTTILVYELGRMQKDAAKMATLKRARDRGMLIYMVARLPV